MWNLVEKCTKDGNYIAEAKTSREMHKNAGSWKNKEQIIINKDTLYYQGVQQNV